MITVGNIDFNDKKQRQCHADDLNKKLKETMMMQLMVTNSDMIMSTVHSDHDEPPFSSRFFLYRGHNRGHYVTNPNNALL